MLSNRIWVIELKIGENWTPILENISGISGVHYTRAEARIAKQGMKEARYYKTSVQFRVKQYEAVK